MNDTLAKLHLMRASILISQSKAEVHHTCKDNHKTTIEEDLDIIEKDFGSNVSVQGEVLYLRAVKDIIQIDKLKYHGEDEKQVSSLDSQIHGRDKHTVQDHTKEIVLNLE